MWSTHALQNLMDAGLPVNYVSSTPGEWAEVDIRPDLSTLK